MNRPTLYLIPTPIGNMEDITIRALKVLELVDCILCEDTRETGKLLKKYNIKNKLISCHEYNEEKVKRRVLDFLESSKNIGLVTDQGTPLISDPGYKIVEFIAQNGYNIVSLPGPTAFVPALTISALPPQPFLFYGFLNAKSGKRKRELEMMKPYPFTLIFYEAPHRLQETIKDMYDVLGDRSFALVRELTKKYEEIRRLTFSKFLLENSEIKGEIVLIVEGLKNSFSYQDLSIKEHVDLYITDGYTLNDAMKKVAKERGIAKSIIYKEYHKDK